MYKQFMVSYLTRSITVVFSMSTQLYRNKKYTPLKQTRIIEIQTVKYLPFLYKWQQFEIWEAGPRPFQQNYCCGEIIISKMAHNMGPIFSNSVGVELGVVQSKYNLADNLLDIKQRQDLLISIQARKYVVISTYLFDVHRSVNSLNNLKIQ